MTEIVNTNQVKKYSDEDFLNAIDELILMVTRDIQQCRENVKAFNECAFMDMRVYAKFAKESIKISQKQLKLLAHKRNEFVKINQEQR